jgi:signal peptidase I
MSTPRRSVPRELLSVGVIAGVLFCARASLADHYTVPTGSMEPTVAVDDQVCVNKLAYGLRIPASQTYVARTAEPQRGEVVVLLSPTDGTVLLKRIVAVPGDVVAVVAGRPILDGVPASTNIENGAVVERLGEHTHALGTSFGGGPDLAPALVPQGRYLVLGDNRGNSQDGRSFGWVERDAILGRAAAVCVHGGRPVWQPL